MPTLAELTHLYEDLPVTPPPLPRKRDRPSGKTISAPPPKHHPTDKNNARHRPPLLARLLSYFPFYSAPVAPPESAPMRINPFTALRQGNKTIIIAVVDAGIVSFFRFGQGAFEEWPMVSAPRG
jgi:tRNA-splicing endonuclease subunit Sen54